MKLWNKIDWPALNLRARNIEADLWQWSPPLDAVNEPEAKLPTPHPDRAMARALMVWSDDGGPVV